MSIKQNITSLQNLLEAVNALPEAGEGGIDTSDATATADDIASGVTAYVNGEKITGTIPHIDHSYVGIPSQQGDYVNAIYFPNYEKRIIGSGKKLTIHSKLTNYGDVAAEDVMSGKTFTSTAGLKKTGTFTLDEELTTQDDLISQIQTALEGKASGSEPILQDKIVTPSTSEQIIVADSGYDGLSNVTVEGDENLISENIISGVSIFGVEGNAESGGEINASGYTFIQHNLPEDYPYISVNGIDCLSGVITKVPFNGTFDTFAFFTYGMFVVDDITVSYKVEGDDGLYEETSEVYWQNMDDLLIYGVFMGGSQDTTLTFNIIYS